MPHDRSDPPSIDAMSGSSGGVIVVVSVVLRGEAAPVTLVTVSMRVEVVPARIVFGGTTSVAPLPRGAAAAAPTASHHSYVSERVDAAEEAPGVHAGPTRAVKRIATDERTVDGVSSCTEGLGRAERWTTSGGEVAERLR